MKNYLLLIVLIFSINIAFSQKENDPKYEIHYKQLNEQETDNYTLKITDAHSQQTFTMFRLHLTNKTTDYLILKAEEINFIYDFGVLHPKKKDYLIEPGESLNKVIKVSDASKDFHVKSLKVKINGIYKLSSKGEVIKMPDFQLPANKNYIEAQGVSCKLNNLSKETQQTVVQFKCTYKGNNYLIINPLKASAKIEDGREFAPVNRKAKTKMITKNKKKKFSLYFEIQAKIIDMQFATFNIVWHDAFRESKPEKIDGVDLNFEYDEEKTKLKNN